MISLLKNIATRSRVPRQKRFAKREESAIQILHCYTQNWLHNLMPDAKGKCRASCSRFVKNLKIAKQSFKPSWVRRACVTVQAPHPGYPPLIEILLLKVLFSEVLDQIKSRHTFKSRKGSVNMIL